MQCHKNYSIYIPDARLWVVQISDGVWHLSLQMLGSFSGTGYSSLHTLGSPPPSTSMQ